MIHQRGKSFRGRNLPRGPCIHIVVILAEHLVIEREISVAQTVQSNFRKATKDQIHFLDASAHRPQLQPLDTQRTRLVVTGFFAHSDAVQHNLHTLFHAPHPVSHTLHLGFGPAQIDQQLCHIRRQRTIILVNRPVPVTGQ